MAASVSKKVADLKRETLVQWRSWAQAIADGGATPSPMAVLEAAAVLGISELMAALEALGRKNWMFIGSVAAGYRAADLMSLVSSAARNDLDVFMYVKDVLDRLLGGEKN